MARKLTVKQHKFCAEYVKSGNATNAAIVAGYSPKTACKIASENQTKPEIKAKLAELMASTETDAVLTVSQRKKLLTQFALEDNEGKFGLDRNANIKAVSELNRMEMVGTPAGTVINNSNTTINVLVRSEGSKQLLDSIGNRPKQLMAGPAEDNT